MKPRERSDLLNIVVISPLLGIFPVPKLPPSTMGGEEKWALNGKCVKDLSLLPSISFTNHVKMMFVKYLLVCLLVESVTVCRTALPEPNEENQNIYYAFFFAKNILILFGNILNIVVCLIIGVAHFPFMGLT